MNDSEGTGTEKEEKRPTILKNKPCHLPKKFQVFLQHNSKQKLVSQRVPLQTLSITNCVCV